LNAVSRCGRPASAAMRALSLPLGGEGMARTRRGMRERRSAKKLVHGDPSSKVRQRLVKSSEHRAAEIHAERQTAKRHTHYGRHKRGAKTRTEVRARASGLWCTRSIRSYKGSVGGVGQRRRAVASAAAGGRMRDGGGLQATNVHFSAEEPLLMNTRQVWKQMGSS